ncbi:MAG: DUF4390 domain-containing protein [Gammaproteobacteria bacterium]|nr:DUF4390 domain-containing protein [Gammaproteobacteria bacterium]
MTHSLTEHSDEIMSKRRRRKRCPKCQFFIILASILIGSFAVFFLFNVLPHLTNKGNFQVVSASSYEHKNGIVIDADLKMRFPDAVVDALENGIPLTIAVEVQVLRERIWWRNVFIKRSVQLFELRYHPLTNVHEVTNIATGERYSFNTRQDAMAVLGTIRGARLIENKELTKNEQYSVQMRISLDISHLPPALRQVASLSSSWRLESTWYQWPMSNKPKAPEQAADNMDLILELNQFNAVSGRIDHGVPDDVPIKAANNTSTNNTLKNNVPSSEEKEQSE